MAEGPTGVPRAAGEPVLGQEAEALGWMLPLAPMMRTPSRDGTSSSSLRAAADQRPVSIDGIQGRDELGQATAR